MIMIYFHYSGSSYQTTRLIARWISRRHDLHNCYILLLSLPRGLELKIAVAFQRWIQSSQAEREEACALYLERSQKVVTCNLETKK